MPQPFLYLGDVGLVGEGVGGGSAPGVDTEAGDGVQQAHRTDVVPDDVLVDGDRMQGLGKRLGGVVLDGAEQRAFQVLGVPDFLQARGNEALRRHMERQVVSLITLPCHPDMGHPFPLAQAAHGQRAEFLAA